VTLATDAQIPPEIQPSAPVPSHLLAPWWHTALLITVLLFASLSGTRGRHPVAEHSKLPQYLWGITWEWILLGFTWLGIRKRIKLRELIGGRWASMEYFLLDVVFAGAFWVCALIVLGIGAKLMRLDQAGKIEHAQAARISHPGIEARTCRLVLYERHRGLLRRNHLPRLSATPVRSHHQLGARGRAALGCGLRRGAWIRGRRAHGPHRDLRIDVRGAGVVAQEPSARDDRACLARRVQRRGPADAEVSGGVSARFILARSESSSREAL